MRQVLTCFRILTVWFLLLFVGLLFVCLGFFCPPTKFGQLVPYNNTVLIVYFPNITTLRSIYPDLLPNLCHEDDENVCPDQVWQNDLGVLYLLSSGRMTGNGLDLSFL